MRDAALTLWKAARENARRERVWFSPHCLAGRQADLFEASA